MAEKKEKTKTIAAIIATKPYQRAPLSAISVGQKKAMENLSPPEIGLDLFTVRQ